MSEFEYLLAFESILYGLLVAKFLERWNILLANRKSIEFYWPHTLLSASVLFATIARFKNRFFSPDFESIGKAWEVMNDIFIPLALLYSLTYQFFPSESRNLDLKKHLKSNSLIYLIGSIFFIHGSIDIYFAPYYPAPFYLVGLFGVLFGIPLFWYNETYVKILATLTFLIGVQQLIN